MLVERDSNWIVVIAVLNTKVFRLREYCSCYAFVLFFRRDFFDRRTAPGCITSSCGHMARQTDLRTASKHGSQRPTGSGLPGLPVLSGLSTLSGLSRLSRLSSLLPIRTVQIWLHRNGGVHRWRSAKAAKRQQRGNMLPLFCFLSISRPNLSRLTEFWHEIHRV